MSANVAIEVNGLSHRYGQRQAIRDLSFAIETGKVFAVLGPNGGGKTTLFRLLSTLLPIQQGTVAVAGLRLPEDTWAIRASIGVVFQSASVDKKLTVSENLRHQAALYGIFGREFKSREAELLQQLRLSDRRHERTETLSGGLRRRVELAKGMIHRPRVLLMDEPSTGLDPGARRDLWQYLIHLRESHGVTVLLTTHLLDEAERSDQIAIIHQGQLVALDSPDALRSTVRGESITIQAQQPEELANQMRQQFDCAPQLIDGRIRLEQSDGHQWIPRIVEAFPGRIDSITLGRPTLEDVFIDRTGHRLNAVQGDVDGQ